MYLPSIVMMNLISNKINLVLKCFTWSMAAYPFERSVSPGPPPPHPPCFRRAGRSSQCSTTKAVVCFMPCLQSERSRDVATTGFRSDYLSGILPYLPRHVTTHKNVLNASLNKTFPLITRLLIQGFFLVVYMDKYDINVTLCLMIPLPPPPPSYLLLLHTTGVTYPMNAPFFLSFS